MSGKTNKGSTAEEILRNYFLSIGYFVVRGCKFNYDGFEVTDIDLWIYGKSSAVSRERVNVDIKNKKTPQALERVFWAKGLQDILGLDSCIVATTDNRNAVKLFGLKHKIRVLDGAFMARLSKSLKSHQDRITEEEFHSQIKKASLGKLGGDWLGMYSASKSRLLDCLSFDGINAWLDDCEYFMEQASTGGGESLVARRLLYLTTAKLLVAIDFMLAKNISADAASRAKILDDGFRYGSAGKGFSDRMSKMMSSIIGGVSEEVGLGSAVENELKNQIKAVRAHVLADYFSQNGVSNSLFDIAREFEASGFSSELQSPEKLSSSAQSILVIVADFYQFDRKKVYV